MDFEDLLLELRSDYRCYLDITPFKFGEDIKSIRILAKALRFNQSLRYIRISSIQQFVDEKIKIIADAIRQNQNIKEIKMEECKLGKDGIEDIANLLKDNYGLKSLSIKQKDEIEAEFVNVLVEAFRLSKKLEYFCLERIPLNIRGINILADAVKMHSSLKQLHLSFMKLKDDEACLIAEAVKENSSLIFF